MLAESECLLAEEKEKNEVNNVDEFELKRTLFYELMQNLLLNVLILLFPFTKIWLGMHFLFKNHQSCSEPIDSWLRLTMANEITLVIYLIFSCSIHIWLYRKKLSKEEKKKFDVISNENNIDNESPLESSRFLDSQTIYELLASFDCYNLFSSLNFETEKKHKILIFFRFFNQFAYVGLFFWGCIILSSKKSNCYLLCPEIFHYCQALLLLSSIYIFMPIVVLILVCVFIPFLLLISICIKGLKKNSLDKKIMDQLERKEFNLESFPEYDECVICRANYEKGEKMIILPCNSKHYFHEACLVKWLEINCLCPICRANLNQKNSSSGFLSFGSERSFTISILSNDD